MLSLIWRSYVFFFVIQFSQIPHLFATYFHEIVQNIVRSGSWKSFSLVIHLAQKTNVKQADCSYQMSALGS